MDGRRHRRPVPIGGGDRTYHPHAACEEESSIAQRRWANRRYAEGAHHCRLYLRLRAAIERRYHRSGENLDLLNCLVMGLRLSLKGLDGLRDGSVARHYRENVYDRSPCLGWRKTIKRPQAPLDGLDIFQLK